MAPTFDTKLRGRNRNGFRLPALISTCLLVASLLSATLSYAQRPFVTVWKTSESDYGQTATDIYFPGLGSNYLITWVGRINGRTVFGELTGNGRTRVRVPGAGTWTLYAGPGSGTFYGLLNAGYSANPQLSEVRQWGDVRWTALSNAFKDYYNMNVTATDVPDLSAVTDLSGMFSGCGALTGTVAFSAWNTSHITNMAGMFSSAKNFNQPIGNWNTANVTSMASMFSGCRLFNQPLAGWNTSRIANMAWMFNGAQSFNQPIGNWNTANVTSMASMFSGAAAFNQPIGNWNTARVTNMSAMFYFPNSFNQPIGNWNISGVKDLSHMFTGNPVFNQPVGNWNTANVTNMRGVFSNTGAFNQPLANWNTGQVTNMYWMFYGAQAFNQPIEKWNTANVTTMYGMFGGAAAFNQSLGSLIIGNVTNMETMLDNCGMSRANYDKTLEGWSGQKVRTGIQLGALSMKYCHAWYARRILTRFSQWRFSGDINDCSDCPGCRTTVADNAIPEPAPNPVATITAYPNPVREKLFLDTGGQAVKGVIIKDLRGNEVLTERNTPGSGSSLAAKGIRTNHLSAGFYILETETTSGRRYTQKIVIER
ncbi:BspA family leucine-rich repeat surface protein [Ravibacter arvi]|uniref:BspA family leucine-rich repeat surface protein n=1 Tax=Ravibacter arvi TaxID=2051041 RepID=A0ABP8M6I7_9BACT